MKLLEEDEHYLNSKQYVWEFISGNNEGYLIIKDFQVNVERYQISKTDLMIRIPAGYNLTPLDCFFTDPHIKMSDGTYPPAADQILTFINRQWQQFSRHWGEGWKAGVDGVKSMLIKAHEELQI